MADVTVLVTSRGSGLYIDGELRFVKSSIDFKDIAIELADIIKFEAADRDDGAEFPIDLDDTYDDREWEDAA